VAYRKRAALGRTVLTTGFIGTLAVGLCSTDQAQSALELRVFPYATLDSEGLAIARRTAQSLFEAAGIAITWRQCGSPVDDCPDSSGAVPFVRVHLLPVNRSSDPMISGDAIPATKGARIALVYVPRVRQIVEKIRLSAEGRSMPELATLTTAHVVGLTVAHEVGHTMGLNHASVGVMRARLDVEDIIAARRSTLAFRASERKRMQQALRRER
jgi:hypothetical protein